ncbi:hypothetical protein GCM10009767_32170 [Kocuria aegyptia]|uniref:Uncharacterized protein n=1 Tax=Kocuria aegyptia TaxID=330943 RepID=A0ABN2L1F6_9MICC
MAGLHGVGEQPRGGAHVLLGLVPRVLCVQRRAEPGAVQPHEVRVRVLLPVRPQVPQRSGHGSSSSSGRRLVVADADDLTHRSGRRALLPGRADPGTGVVPLARDGSVPRVTH